MPRDWPLYVKTNSVARTPACALPREPVSCSQTTGPRAYRGVAAAVGMENRERVSRARLAANRDQHAAAGGQRLEDPGVVRLKSDAAHRAGQPELREIAARPLQPFDERPARHDRPNPGELEPFGWRSERLLDERGVLRRILREDRQRLHRKRGVFERIDALLRPRHVLKHPNRESSCFDLDHGRVMYHGACERAEMGPSDQHDR